MRFTAARSNSAHKHLLELANKGHAKSQTLMGVMYRDGVGVEKDLGQAASWFEKAAQQGLREAENELGHLYLFREASVHNPSKAELWLTRAAEHGVVVAQRDLGMLYLRGDIVGVDHDKAVIWLKRAAAQGSEEAQKTLSELPGGEQLQDAAAKGQAAIRQNSQDVSQGMSNVETLLGGLCRSDQIHAKHNKNRQSISDNQFWSRSLCYLPCLSSAAPTLCNGSELKGAGIQMIFFLIWKSLST